MTEHTPYSELVRDWDHGEVVPVVSCPQCAFTFAAEHVDEGGGYSCPYCAELRLEEQLEAAQRKVEAYDRARARVKSEGATRAEYVLLAESALEQFEALQKKLYHAGDMCCRPVGTCVDAEWFTPIVAQPSNPASRQEENA